jgi:hypothetical protein
MPTYLITLRPMLCRCVSILVIGLNPGPFAGPQGWWTTRLLFSHIC